jgi:hypothetical protein
LACRALLQSLFCATRDHLCHVCASLQGVRQAAFPATLDREAAIPETAGYTASENARNINRNWNYDLRQTTDDWNHLWLQDRPSRLTQWSVQ